MPKKTKKILEAHAKAAAEERYGVTLNKEARREIVQKIQTGDADFVSRTSNNRTLWKVDYQETSMNVVYDKSRHALCTVLPKTAWEFQTPQGDDVPAPNMVNWWYSGLAKSSRQGPYPA